MKKSSSKLVRKNNRQNRGLIIVFAILAALVGVYVVRSSFAYDLANPNQLAIVDQDPNKPYVIERTKTATGYEERVTSQPFAMIATTQGEVYCANGENEMRKVVLNRERIKQAVGEARRSDKTGIVRVKARLRAECLASKAQKKLKAKDLPQFTLPSKSQPLSLITTAHALTSAVDYAAEKDQMWGININRFGNKPQIPNLKRMTCMDTVSRNWSRWMVEVTGLQHNPNFAKQIQASCKRNDWRFMAENVGYGPSSPALMAAFKASPGHWRNIMNTKASQAGIGTYRNANGRLYVTHNFMGF